jgi:PTH1 family peptidyl-tRNA hydrolase
MSGAELNPNSEIRIPKSPWLVLGLGNPGQGYADTYHNVGFRAVQRIAEKLGVRIDERCGPALISGRVEIARRAAVLVLPQTFMNLSGLALPQVFERFGASPESLIVVYDDVALPIGRIRIRRKGSAGGHNGVKSLISACDSDQFIRVRVGIMPERPIDDVRGYVLSRVAKADRMILKRAEDAAVSAVSVVIEAGVDKAMSEFNRLDLRETGDK